jgi:hypothetical protein
MQIPRREISIAIHSQYEMALEKVVSLFAPNDPLRLQEEDGFLSLPLSFRVAIPFSWPVMQNVLRKLDCARSEKVSSSQTMDAIRRLSGHNA